MLRVCVPLAKGFEELEAITLIDVIRRADIEVVITGINGDSQVEGAHNIKILVDAQIQEIKVNEIDLIVLPGGLPGAYNLAKSKEIQNILKDMSKKNKMIGAICAAPYVLHKAGVLNANYTAYPSWEQKIKLDGYVTDKKTVEDKNIITSRGPGTAICFALEIVKKLKGHARYKELKKDLLVDYC